MDNNDMAVRKPILTVDEQIEHLKNKGVSFSIMDEKAAADYLTFQNNYFKLSAYRKNYSKHPDGVNAGKYIHLDFAYLVDLAVIDMRFRYRIVQMALDIEHYAKLQLLREISAHGEDGYSIVSDYVNSLSKKQRDIFSGELNRSRENIYCGDIFQKYDGHYPVWALFEIIPFGRFVSFYKFCAIRFDDKKMMDTYYRLLTCKEIRNASAHSNCILNDLHADSARHKANADVTRAIMQMSNMNTNFRKNRMSNARIQQIATLFYVHRSIVTSDGVKYSEAQEMQRVKNRMLRNRQYYDSNSMLTSTFEFLKILIDSWFPCV